MHLDKQQRNKNTKFPFYFNFCINQDSSSVNILKIITCLDLSLLRNGLAND